MAELAQVYLRERMARREITISTAANHRYVLRVFIRDVGQSVAALDLRALELWVEARGRLSVASRRTHFDVVRGFCAWLTRRGYLSENPMQELSKPRLPKRVPKALAAEQVAVMLETIKRPRDRAMAWLMVGMGLRCGEVAALRVEDWDQRVQTLFVRGKGEHERVLPVPGEVATALRAHLAERTVGATGPMFRSFRSPTDGLRPHSISRLMGEWMFVAEVKRAARDGVSAHSLRHTCASDVLDRCGDLRLVQNLLGHGNVATTSVYLRRASLGKLRDAMEGRDYRV